MNSQKVKRWDVPVIRALDRVEQLPGFTPDHVAWDHFVFGANGLLHRPMDTASIYAFPLHPPTPEDRLVRFCFSTTTTPRYRAGFTVTNVNEPPMSTAELVRALDVPMRSAIQTKALLHYALQTSLEEYNTNHATRRHPVVSETLETAARTSTPRGPSL